MTNIESLNKALKERILVLDGAMGTMLQRYKFEEEDYRGDRFKDWEHPVKGNNDLLSLTQPQAIEEVHKNTLKQELISLRPIHFQEQQSPWQIITWKIWFMN